MSECSALIVKVNLYEQTFQLNELLFLVWYFLDYHAISKAVDH